MNEDMRVFASGAKSSAEAPRYDLIEPALLERLAARMAQGAASHGARNYRRGKDDPAFVRDRVNHLVGHALKLAAGDTSEDHLGAVAANCNILAFLLTDSPGDAEPDTVTDAAAVITGTAVTGTAVTVAPPDVRRTYDDVRGEAGPCLCGRIYTHPGYCERTGRCGALEHPHATP